jgi:phytoene dehydrogenase-like protein
VPDVVVIGAGPNGLTGANVLADAGWDVLVLEEQPEPGGAVRTGELVEPGFHNDLFSAFYPLTAASPVMEELDLEAHGLMWRRADIVVAHPARDEPCAVISTDIDETAASLDAFAPGDGNAWRDLQALWRRVGDHLLEALFRPFPPVRGPARLVAELGLGGLPRFLRFAALPVRRLAEERFAGAGGGRLLAGNALHADLGPESVGSGLYGWLLCSVGQEIGYPVPEGGSAGITRALVRRLHARGGEVRCGEQVTRVLAREGRAGGVVTASGEEIRARAVLAGTGAPQLFRDLVDTEHLPDRVRRDMDDFEYDSSTVKVDWALDSPIPWRDEEARRAGTVHVAAGMDALTDWAAEIAKGLIPRSPFLVLGQYSSFDPSRAPAGREAAWAYTHVPQRIRGDARGELSGRFDEDEANAFAGRMEEEVEALAPGFRASIRGRHIFTPQTMEAANRNLVGGALGGGTAQIHQQLVFRPVAGFGRPETPLRGLYLASASAHPGGGVHGAAGANAARAAIAAERPARRLLARVR